VVGIGSVVNFITCGGTGTSSDIVGWTINSRIYNSSFLSWASVEGGVTTTISTNYAPPNNTWTHIAIVRSSNTIKIYADGVEKGSGLDTHNITSSNPLLLGTTHEKDGRYLQGYMDNIRLVKGQALWTENFDLTEEALFYKSASDYVRPDNLRNLYNISSTKGSLRGKAKSGFVRPTISQFFTSKNFENIESSKVLDTYLIPFRGAQTTEDNLTVTGGDPSWNGAYLPGYKTEGKWYAEFRQNTNDQIWVGVVNPDYYDNYMYQTPGAVFSANGGKFSVMPDTVNDNRYYTAAVASADSDSGDYRGVGWDFETATLEVYKNGVLVTSFTHEPTGASLLSKVTFYILLYPGGRSSSVAPNKNSVVYPIPNGYEYFGEDI
jgi:hypothetical protein